MIIWKQQDFVYSKTEHRSTYKLAHVTVNRNSLLPNNHKNFRTYFARSNILQTAPSPCFHYSMICFLKGKNASLLYDLSLERKNVLVLYNLSLEGKII